MNTYINAESSKSDIVFTNHLADQPLNRQQHRFTINIGGVSVKSVGVVVDAIQQDFYLCFDENNISLPDIKKFDDDDCMDMDSDSVAPDTREDRMVIMSTHDQSTSIMVSFKDWGDFSTNLEIACVGSVGSVVDSIKEKVVGLCADLDPADAGAAKNNFFMIGKWAHGLTKKKFEIHQEEVDLTKNYNDDFIAVDERIRHDLENTNKGIVLLHGQPGTGKTSYIRHLVKAINKKVLYIPPDMTSAISDPEFISFMMKNKNCVLVIEDAENVLARRDGSQSQAVANLLNISDGMLSDALRLQLICTFNCDIGDIDSALKRPGRMIANYEFGKLTEEKSNALMLDMHQQGATGPMTIGEIYAVGNNPMTNEKETQFGFI